MYSLINIAALAISLLVSTGFSDALPVQRLSTRGANDGHNGAATYYNTESNNGACGWYNRNNEHVIAISQSLWDETSNGQGGSTSCGRSATINFNGRSVQVTVVDLCPECQYNDIDMSPSAFEQLSSKDAGRLHGVDWRFN